MNCKICLAKDCDCLCSTCDEMRRYNRLQLMSIAKECRRIVLAARADGIEFNREQMLDLVADNIEDVSLDTLRVALVIAGVGY